MKRIVIVEDDEFIRDLVAEKIESSGFDVVAVAEAESVLELLTEMSTDLVILDLNLPSMTGLECMSHIKAHEAFAGIPIIIFSNNPETGSKEAALAQGANAYFVKVATDLNELVHTINDLTSK